MKRMYSKQEVEAIVSALLPTPIETHVYSLYKGEGIGTTTGSQTTVYFVSNKDITSASDLIKEDIHNKVIGINYHEWDNSDSDAPLLWVALGNFATDSNGKLNFYRVKDKDTVYDGITDVNVTLATLKTYTLTKLV